jgi:hypothetical protein
LEGKAESLRKKDRLASSFSSNILKDNLIVFEESIGAWVAAQYQRACLACMWP